MLTSPAIHIAQNEPQAHRRLAAQSRLYSDVKRAHSIRFATVLVVGLVVAGLTLAHNDSPVGGAVGIAAFFADGLLIYRERRRVELAVAVQEDFDCMVFRLPWNDIVLRRRPTGQQIAAAAERYTGDRQRDWYPATGTLQRPLDILVCQQSNVGWGAPVHRAWAWVLVLTSSVSIGLVVCVWWAAHLSVSGGLNDLIAPFLAMWSELVQSIRENFESARAKEDCDEQILSEWAAALTGVAITEQRCRAFQDAIARIRLENAQVPDWFDKRLRPRSERAMRTNATDMIDQAAQAGLT